MSWVIGVLLSAIYLIGGVSVTRLPATAWDLLFAANLVTGLVFYEFTQRFNLVEHERKSWGLTGMALELVTAPVYVAAAAAQLAGRPLAYVVTPKGAAATGDTLRTFRPHLIWAAVAAGSLAAGQALGHDYPSLYVWSTMTLLISIAPIVHVVTGRVRASLPQRSIRAARPYLVTTQRRTGELLVRAGLLTEQQLDGLLDLQATSDSAWQRLGDLAIEQGLVDAGQVAAAVDADRLVAVG